MAVIANIDVTIQADSESNGGESPMTTGPPGQWVRHLTLCGTLRRTRGNCARLKAPAGADFLGIYGSYGAFVQPSDTPGALSIVDRPE